MARTIQQYSGDSYTAIRDKENSWGAGVAEVIEKGIQASTKKYSEDDYLYRGIKVSKQSQFFDHFNNLQKGDIINQMGLSSWTTNMNIAKAFAKLMESGATTISVIFKEKTRGERNGISIQAISQFRGEQEVLMSKNAKWRIIDMNMETINQGRQVIVIGVEEVKDDKANKSTRKMGARRISNTDSSKNKK